MVDYSDGDDDDDDDSTAMALTISLEVQRQLKRTNTAPLQQLLVTVLLTTHFSEDNERITEISG